MQPLLISLVYLGPGSDKYLGRNIYRLGERIRVVSAAFLCN